MSDTIGPSEVVFHLPLTAAELKITHAALHAFADAFGHDERDVHDVVRRVLAKLPDEGSLHGVRIT